MMVPNTTAIEFEKWKKQFEGNIVQTLVAADDVRAKAARKLFNYLRTISPVGDPQSWQILPDSSYTPGHFKASWQINTYDKGKVKIRNGSSPTGSTIEILNDAEYAWRLEQGWSRQAPNGTLRVGIAKWPEFVKQSQNEVRIKRR